MPALSGGAPFRSIYSRSALVIVVMLTLLVSAFGIFALAEAFFTIGAGLSVNWLFLFLEGVFGGAIGLLAVFYQPVAENWFIELIAAWAIVTGTLHLIGAITLRRLDRTLTTGEWLLVANGLVTLVFGMALAMWADPLAPMLVSVVTAYAIVSGVLLLALALNIRTWRPLIPAEA